MTLVRLIALVTVLFAASPRTIGASQVRHCVDLAEEIAAGIGNRGVVYFTLRAVRADEVGDRRVVGSCEGGAMRIVYEPRGRGEFVPYTPPAPKTREPKAPERKTPEPKAPELKTPEAGAPKPEAKADVAPKSTAPPPAAPVAPVAPVAPAAPTLTVRRLEPTSAPRQMSRDQLASLRTLAVDQGADDRDSLEEFAKHLKIGSLPDLASSGGRSSDFVIVESDHTDPAAAFTMITNNGKIILAERASWVIGLLPEQHAGFFDLCLLAKDFPEPGASYSDWTLEFDGSRYVKKNREFKGKSCLDRVEVKIAR